MKNPNYPYDGDCRDEILVEKLFGSVTNFAQLVEQLGNEFVWDGIQVDYDEASDIHFFIT